MMVRVDINDLLADAFGRLPGLVRGAVAGLDAEQLRRPPAPGANTVGWLVWHLTRIQDDHVADLIGDDQIWVTGPWAPRFELNPDPADTGYAHGPDEVLGVRPASGKVLVDYYMAVHERTAALIRAVSPEDLDRIVDKSWNPPVTMGVRLVSVLNDDVQHVGQAAYVRGIILR
ncbi:Protein of unknown function [Asanoa ishikariensis]|uniref:DinB-like domain-containing protein n=2 Tax=Asanoa ishikariensis TaxID=137265 RepID=A0A1H3R4C2_9ACTN|nr:Protein of unknown function [Asanoa ishikariensis]